MNIKERMVSARRFLIRGLGTRGVLNFVPDKAYLRLVYWCETGKALRLDPPVTYNEKLQWLKLHDRREEQTICVDKYSVRSYIRDTIGDEYLVPLLGVYHAVEEIDWDALPSRFVLKCTHGSHCNIVCGDKSKLDVLDAQRKLKRWLKRNWYWYGREWPYKNVKPRIIREEYLGDNITDYKFMCFGGEPKIVQVHRNRGTKQHTTDFYDTNWEKTEIRRKRGTSEEKIPRPVNLRRMIDIARELSRGEIHVRVDLYEVDGKVYFGEKTYYSASGFAPFAEDYHDERLGDWIELSVS